MHVVPARDDDGTGAFEVFVNGRLVHSKLNGDGFLEEDEQLDVVFEQINQALKKEGEYATSSDGAGAAAAATEEGRAPSVTKSAATPLLGGGGGSDDDEVGDGSGKGSSAGGAVKGQADAASKRSLVVSMCTLLLSIPALIGA